MDADRDRSSQGLRVALSKVPATGLRSRAGCGVLLGPHHATTPLGVRRRMKPPAEAAWKECRWGKPSARVADRTLLAGDPGQQGLCDYTRAHGPAFLALN